MSAYRKSKQRERAEQLAESGITFDEAMVQIERRQKSASETLAKMAKAKRKAAKIKRDKKEDKAKKVSLISFKLG